MEAPVRIGEVLANKYRVDRVLGVGGMGVVIAATHLQLDQKVALKFMLREAFVNEDALARFTREARAAVRLKSEHVARVSDTGVFDNGSPYIVMEYLDGTDLVGELEKRGPLPVADVAEYIIQACDALAEAHALGIIHRDLKPANLFLARRHDGSPLVKVLDFGISKASGLNEGGVELTKTASMMGSPLYMSPEQIRSSKDVDVRTDVWALGIIMYQLLSGSVPFSAETIGGLLALVMMELPPPLEQTRPDLPPQVRALVARCLEKSLATRCQHVGEIAVALAPFCPSRSLPLVDRITAATGAPPVVGTTPHGPSPMSQSLLAATARADAPMTPMSRAGQTTGTPWTATGRDAGAVTQPARPSMTWIIPVILVAVGVLAVGGFAGYRAHSASKALANPVVETPSAVASSPSSVAPSSSPSSVAPSAQVEASRAPTPNASAPKPVAHAVHSATHVVAPAAPPVPPKNCETPYTIDSDGRKIPKPECI